MPRKTDGEKVDALEKLTAEFGQRLNNHDGQLKSILEALEKSKDACAGTAKETTKLIEELRLAIHSLESSLKSLTSWKDELKKEKDEATRRFWAFGPNITAAVIGGIVAFAVAWYANWLRGSRSPNPTLQRWRRLHCIERRKGGRVRFSLGERRP